MVTRASKALWTEVNPEYQADPRDFTDADIAAGKLREADDADTAAEPGHRQARTGSGVSRRLAA